MTGFGFSTLEILYTQEIQQKYHVSIQCQRLLLPTPAIVFGLPTDEFVQYEGPDAALVRFRGLWIAVGWRCRVHRLLAADGGRHCPATEPDH